MSYPYAVQYKPAFPTIPIMLRSLSGETTSTQTALVDTGADGTLMPLELLQSIHADEQYVARVRSHWGEWRAASVFLIDLEIGNQIFPSVEVVADESGSVVLLGRNVINLLTLLLDGPHRQTDVLSRRPVRL